MQFQEVDAIVRDLTGIPSAWGRRLYDFVLAQRPQALLELGFCHGKSSCYMAAALHELGTGRLTTVDMDSALERRPHVHELLAKTGLASFVDVVTGPTSYTWFLKKDIESATRDGRTVPKYDFCFLDGAHSWEADGLAFFLADKLLKHGGHMLFDDYSWSYGTSSALKNTDAVKQMPADERDAKQVALIFELLVKQHPNYADFSVDDDNWAWARKVHQHEAGAIRSETRLISPVTELKRLLRL